MTVDTVTGEIVADLTRDEARALTDEIKVSAEKVYSLLLTAHERKAWTALGYATWRDYATAEFGMSQSRAYQLLDSAKVIREIESAANFSTKVEITEREARDIKPHLAAVTDAIRAEVAKVTADRAPEVAQRVIAEHRQRIVAERTQQQDDEQFWGDVLATADPGSVARASAERPYHLAIVGMRNAARILLADAGTYPAAVLAAHLPDHLTDCIDELAAAHQYLTDFLTALEA